MKKVLQFLAGCAFVAGMGLLFGIAAVLVLEVVLMLVDRRSAQHNGTPLICSTLGIVAGYLIYPAPSSPAALGVASLLLALLIHGGIYLMFAGILEKK